MGQFDLLHAAQGAKAMDMLGMQQQLGLEQSLADQRLAAQQTQQTGLMGMGAMGSPFGMAGAMAGGLGNWLSPLTIGTAGQGLIDGLDPDPWPEKTAAIDTDFAGYLRGIGEPSWSFAVRKQTIGMILSAISLILTALWVWGMGP